MTRRLVILPLFAALALGCAEAEQMPSALASASAELPAHPRWELSHPPPEQRLVSFTGSLCPAEESLAFYDSPGATTLTLTNAPVGQVQCRIEIEMTIPAGYRIHRTTFYTGGYAFNEETSPRDSTVKIHYGLTGERLTSEHVVTSREPGEPVDGAFLLVDTPDFSEPECAHANEPSVLDLSIEVEVDVAEGNHLNVSAIDYELDRSRWVGCDEAF